MDKYDISLLKWTNFLTVLILTTVVAKTINYQRFIGTKRQILKISHQFVRKMFLSKSTPKNETLGANIFKVNLGN